MVKRLLQLLVGVDQALHRVVVGGGVRGGHVLLDTARGTRAPVRELFDQVVGKDFMGWRAGDYLLEKFGGGAGFFKAVGKFDGVWKPGGVLGAMEIFLLVRERLMV